MKKRMPVCMRYNKAIVLLILVCTLILAGCTSSQPAEDKEKLAVEFDIENNSASIAGQTINSLYYYAFSPTGKYLIYSKPEPLCAPDVYVFNTENNTHQRLTRNKADIETQLDIDDNGNYIWSGWDKKDGWSKSIYYNGDPLESTLSGTYHSPVLSNWNGDVIAAYVEEGNDADKLICHNIDTQERISIPLNYFVNELYCKDQILYLLGNCDSDKTNIVSHIDIESALVQQKPEIILESDKQLFIGKIGERGGSILYIDYITGNDDGLYMLNAYRRLYGSQYLNPFSNSNDFYGRLSWNQTYRVFGMVKLYEKTGDESIATQLRIITDNLLSCANEAQGIIDEWNPPRFYTSYRYGHNINEPVSLLVNNASIINALAAAANAGVLEDNTIDEIVSLGREMYEYYESWWSEDKQQNPYSRRA